MQNRLQTGNKKDWVFAILIHIIDGGRCRDGLKDFVSADRDLKKIHLVETKEERMRILNG